VGIASVNADLQAFLESRDLDRLADARERLPAFDAEDIAAVRRVLSGWSEPQAVANLLMHPSLIPESERSAAVQRGLDETRQPYLALAAVVGLRELDVESLPPAERAEVVGRVLALAAADRGVIADRASAFLAERLWHFGDSYAPSVLALLDHPSQTVQHNALAALVPLVGLDNLSDVLTRAVEDGKLSLRGQATAARKLARIRGFSAADPDDGSGDDLGSLSAPLLTYIPNLDDWPA
jgi:hypothetical protein